jgi:hypothetical protein
MQRYRLFRIRGIVGSMKTVSALNSSGIPEYLPLREGTSRPWTKVAFFATISFPLGSIVTMHSLLRFVAGFYSWRHSACRAKADAMGADMKPKLAADPAPAK